MTTPLDPLRSLVGTQPIVPAGNQPPKVEKTADGKSFGDVLNDFVQQVDQAQHQFDAAITAVERGETDNMHTVMLAQSQAQISLKLASEVRNKLVEAYKDVMRTQF